MRIQHEGTDCAFQLGKIALQINKARTADLGSAFEIHQAQGFADLEMLFRIVDAARRAEGALRHRDIVALLRAVRHIGGGQVGKNREQIAHFAFQRALLRFAILDGVLQPRHFGHQRGGLCFVLLGFRLADQLGGFVAPRLVGLQPHQQFAQGLVLGQQLVRLGHGAVAIGGTARQRACKCIASVANGLDVVH